MLLSLKSFGLSMQNRRARRRSIRRARPLAAETLEARQLLSASRHWSPWYTTATVETDGPVESVDIEAGDTHVAFTEFEVHNTSRWWDWRSRWLSVQDVIAIPGVGSASFDGNIESAELWVDWNHDGRSDYRVATAEPEGEILEFDLRRPIFVGGGNPWRPWHLKRFGNFEIKVNMTHNLDTTYGDTLAVEIAEVGMRRLRGGEVPPWQVRYVGQPTHHNLVAPDPDPVLHVESVFTTATSVAVENEDDVRVYRFEALARGDDLFVTGVTFSSVLDDQDLLNAQNWALWVDVTSDGVVDIVLQDGIGPANGQVRFDGLVGGGFLIPEDELFAFELHTDVENSLMSDQLQVQLDDVSVEVAADGSVAGLNLHAEPGVLLELKHAGSLIVTTGVPTPSRQLLLGEEGDYVASIEFEALDEPIDVFALHISVNGDVDSIDRLALYKQGESEPFAYALQGICGFDDVPVADATFCRGLESRDLVVPENGSVTVLVHPLMKSEEEGGTAGDTFHVFIDATKSIDVSTGSGSVRARGDISSNSLVTNNGDGEIDGEVVKGGSANGDIPLIYPQQHVVGAEPRVSRLLWRNTRRNSLMDLDAFWLESSSQIIRSMLYQL